MAPKPTWWTGLCRAESQAPHRGAVARSERPRHPRGAPLTLLAALVEHAAAAPRLGRKWSGADAILRAVKVAIAGECPAPGRPLLPADALRRCVAVALPATSKAPGQALAALGGALQAAAGDLQGVPAAKAPEIILKVCAAAFPQAPAFLTMWQDRGGDPPSDKDNS
ncbi:unnamed protein product [Prorocentrum cordatum]|uniref:Uncharacterized protein n=1 Tax=Prorocentrum cordatum TaxID=2364126 RepID=A0ABN9PRK9_9DINO|nr:unnamed protein product [Polarella glacialis]